MIQGTQEKLRDEWARAKILYGHSNVVSQLARGLSSVTKVVKLNILASDQCDNCRVYFPVYRQRRVSIFGCDRSDASSIT